MEDSVKPPAAPKKDRITFRSAVACLLGITVCGGVMGLIGGRGNFFQRVGNGAFLLFVVILGLYLQCLIGCFIGKFIARSETGGNVGGGIAAALYILGIFPIIFFFKIKAPF